MKPIHGGPSIPGGGGTVLDSLLEELQTVAKGTDTGSPESETTGSGFPVQIKKSENQQEQEKETTPQGILGRDQTVKEVRLK